MTTFSLVLFVDRLCYEKDDTLHLSPPLIRFTEVQSTLIFFTIPLIGERFVVISGVLTCINVCISISC
jgi:hypothetical protein